MLFGWSAFGHLLSFDVQQTFVAVLSNTEHTEEAQRATEKNSN
jgi:hypothetical protein